MAMELGHLVRRLALASAPPFAAASRRLCAGRPLSPLVDGDLQQESAEAMARAYTELVRCSHAFATLQPNAKHSVLLLQPRIDPPFGYGIQGGATEAERSGAYGRFVRSQRRAALEAAEAKALLATLPGWSVSHSVLVPTRYGVAKRLIWGTGKLDELTELAERLPRPATALYVNVDQLNALQIASFMEAFGGRPVFDRYTVVLAIFKLFGDTAEAQLQTQLAEIPYLRQSLRARLKSLVRQSMGGAAGDWHRQKAVLDERQRSLEAALQRAAERRREQLRVAGAAHKRRPVNAAPLVAVVGYTNSGKTSLVSRLSGDAGAKPMDRLFATLNVRRYPMRLPNAVELHLADTVGFVSGLPAALFPAFRATLDHVKFADCVIHMRDCSHPDAAKQAALVERTLAHVAVPQHVLDNATITVDNKCDLAPHYSSPAGVVRMSCQTGFGLDALVRRLQLVVMRSCGLARRTFKVPADESDFYLRYLYKYAGVQRVRQCADDGRFVLITAVLHAAALDKFHFHFGHFAPRKAE